MIKKTEIWTDGACSGNPGPGGWGAVLKHGNASKELYGSEASTTNNRMEMMAAIVALETLKKSSNVILHTDSTYVKDGLTKWIHGWKRNGWKTAAKKPVKNEDLWRRLDEANARHSVEWKWVKGHAGDKGNERADALAVLGAGIAAGKFPDMPTAKSHTHIYKILPREKWEQIKSGKTVPGSDVDDKDGFIHLSTKDETEKSASLYYKDEDAILAIEIKISALKDELKWEWSGSRKAWFPHLYGTLPTKAVTRVLDMERGPRKSWVFA